MGKRRPTRSLALQEDHNVSINCLFLFWASATKYGNQPQGPPKKVKFQACFYQSLTDNMTFPKWSH